MDGDAPDAHINGMIKQIVLVVGVIVFLAGLFFLVFKDFDTSSMDIHGWIALALGAGLSIALGIGLMVLVFLSARRGYDDRVDSNIPDQD
jgi:membrane-bound ClpP family serine protease